jgi:hypothetical protein
VLDEDAGFLERVGVEQEVDALARGQPAFGVELRDALLAAPFEDGLAAPAQLFDGLGTAQLRSRFGMWLGRPLVLDGPRRANASGSAWGDAISAGAATGTSPGCP